VTVAILWLEQEKKSSFAFSFDLRRITLPIVTRGSHLHIAVDGCIGVGKTTLATKLADARKAYLLSEHFEKNPFLEDFYSDPAAHVLETELQFLLLHYHQLKQIPRTSAGETISDFTFSKDLIFAGMNFRVATEKTMFVQLYEFLLERLQSPDLVIYLRGSDDLIVKRVRQRNRPIEQKIDVGYFKKLNKAYEDHFSRFDGQIYLIDADKFDCLDDPAVLNDICAAIDAISPRRPAADSPSKA
jgi:deoxyadenosine/deoxycytidine kinase